MIKKYAHIYLVGIGGIGMSALARYFHQLGLPVAGYDKTASPLTKTLEEEGILVHYEDLGKDIQRFLGTPKNTLVIWTPAVPSDLNELEYLRKNDFNIKKRAVVLGEITQHYKTLAVAGTHGKTTTSTLLAHVLTASKEGCNAFLGGISANFHSNLVIDKKSDWMVVEADEFDRSFLHLSPFASIITSVEADHLDIYQDGENLKKAFIEFGNLTPKEGKLVVSESVELPSQASQITYGLNQSKNLDYSADNLRMEGNRFLVNIQTPSAKHLDVELGLPGIHNVYNALAVIALCEFIGVSFSIIREALKRFKGVKRRFEQLFVTPDIVYIDDYAHHPTAIKNLVNSVRLIYKDKPIVLLFQPHLYTRTRDFMQAFADALRLADSVVLLPIYPARELPIEGITSEALAEIVSPTTVVLEPEEVLQFIKTIKNGVILTVGAGNIDRLVEPIRDYLNEAHH